LKLSLSAIQKLGGITPDKSACGAALPLTLGRLGGHPNPANGGHLKTGQ